VGVGGYDFLRKWVVDVEVSLLLAHT
jgi:hypothetical protein